MLIVFAGLPGVGKTTVARALARKLSAAYIRIDTVEQALLASLPPLAENGVKGEKRDVGAAGYVASYAIAADNLRLGLAVVADCVSPVAATRQSWRNVALETGVKLLEIEVVCSDLVQHKLRAESRVADIPGDELPTWESILNRDYEPWESERLVIDTAQVSAEEAVAKIMRILAAN